MRVYKISTNLTNDQNRNLVKNISEEEANFLSGLDIKVSVDLLDEDDKITTVMVSNILNIEKLKTYFYRSNIEFEIEDITEHFTSETDEEKLHETLSELTMDDILKTFGVEF